MAFVNVEAATFLVGEEGFDAKTPSVVPGGEARIGQIGDEVDGGGRKRVEGIEVGVSKGTWMDKGAHILLFGLQDRTL